MEKTAAFKLSYGLFVLTARDGEKDNGCIVNTVFQVTDNPFKISVTVNKNNYTHDMIKKTGVFNISVLTESVPFSVFQHYGFKSGRDTEKINSSTMPRSENGVVYLSAFTNAFMSAKVVEETDCGTHTMFIAEVTEAQTLSDERSVTYQYYFDNIKPKPQPQKKKGFVCQICGYVYEGDELPEDFVCPICKHSADAFKPL
ncbi:MAG TPA: flavin reductase [Candidatus Eubacterium faecigallinarum]|nr:flavin reductase [Candidatus Eubacterium faecigallinarum]